MGSGGMSETKNQPDDLVLMLAALAKEHGYSMTRLELRSIDACAGASFPRYSYSVSQSGDAE
jgi:hypothetical protein